MRACVYIVVALLALVPAVPARAQDAREPLTINRVVNAFSDAELIRGFLGTVFGAEVMRGNQDPSSYTTVKKYAGPVKVFIINKAERDQSRQVVEFLRILNQTVSGLSIRTVSKEDQANMTVFLVDRAYYRKTIRDTLPDSFDTSFEAQMEKEGNAIAAASVEPDAQEGLDAFLNKRVPVYRGTP